MKKKSVKNTKLGSRYKAIIAFVVLVALGIVWFAVKTSIVYHKEWNLKADNRLKLDSVYVALPMRGSILAVDGQPLAQTVALYSVYVDFKTEALDDTLYTNEPSSSGKCLDILCTYLAENYPEKSKQEYVDYITRRKEQGRRDCYLLRNISEEQFYDFYNMPMLKDRRDAYRGRNQGIGKERSFERSYPYGTLASVVLGKATKVTGEMLQRNPHAYVSRQEWHGTSGMEKELDSLLFGSFGKSRNQQMSFGFKKWVEDPPVDGYDVRTTLDVTIQEITERNLKEKVSEQHAEYGTAIVMDVATGAIRAMANVERTKDGGYTFNTKRNYAITRIEPGSVVKTLSLLMAMEHGNVDVNKKFNSAGAIPETAGYKDIETHRNPLSARDVIIYSDNRGICKIISDVYAGRYNDFFRDIRNSGLMETMDLPLPGVLPPSVKPIHFDKQWTYYAFAQSVFGYYNELSPLTTLSVYNAIANDGKLMLPQLVAALERDGVVDTVFVPVCLNEHFCSPRNAALLREMLHGVVQEGTARGIKNGRVDIAGKTGTVDAQREYMAKDKNGKMRHVTEYVKDKRRLAFAGFFPYDNPQYSCIVVIDKPDLHSAGRVSGAVFRAIAEEMYNRNLLEECTEYKSDEAKKNPPLVAGDTVLRDEVYAYLNQYPLPDTTKTTLHVDTTAVAQAGVPVVPSVIGMSAKDALYKLEQQGFFVSLSGKGRVVSQSLHPGATYHKGENIVLLLN